MSDESPTILVVEDEKPMLLGLVDSLHLEGFNVVTAEDGQDGLRKALELKPDAMILDIMLPKLSGFEVCRALRDKNSQVPILVLSARGQESDKVLALGLGADDYVTKPFTVNELVARVRALVRRASISAPRPESYCFGEVTLDFSHMTAHKGSDQIPITHLELEVMRYLIEHRGEAVPRDDLLREVWHYGTGPTTRAVDNLVARLRKKLEVQPHAPSYLLTVHGYGYKFVD